MFNRRDFLKFMSLMGGVVLNPFQRFGNWSGLAADMIEETFVGELYGGFVLLPEGAPVPDFVQCAPAPVLGFVDDFSGSDPNQCIGETEWFDRLDQLSDSIGFSLYIVKSLPEGMDFINGHIIRFERTKKVFEVRLNYGYVEDYQPRLIVSALPDYPRPYPLLYSPSNQKQVQQGTIEKSETKIGFSKKVALTPTPGVSLPVNDGHFFSWISKNILYTLMIELDTSYEIVTEIVQSLTEI